MACQCSKTFAHTKRLYQAYSIALYSYWTLVMSNSSPQASGSIPGWMPLDVIDRDDLLMANIFTGTDRCEVRTAEKCGFVKRIGPR